MTINKLVIKRQRMQEIMNTEEYNKSGQDSSFMIEYNKLSEETTEMFSNLNEDDFDFVTEQIYG